MQSEFEAKFPLDVSKEDFRERLRKSGASLLVAERVMRRVLFGQEHNPGLTCDYIRLRDEVDKVTLSAKKHIHGEEGSMGDNKEAVTEVSDFDATLSVLREAGLIQSSDQQTKRESWIIGDTHVEIDTWPGLAPYVEIESTSEALVQQTAELLELDWSRRAITSVEELFMERYHFSKEETRQRLAFCTFERHGFMDDTSSNGL